MAPPEIASPVRRLLTINTGSSSVKAALYRVGETERRELAVAIERIGRSGSRMHAVDAAGVNLLDHREDLPTHDAALGLLFAWLNRRGLEGFNEQGTTTTPFQTVVLNGMSRYHLAFEALRRTTRLGSRALALMDEYRAAIAQSTAYAREHLEDPPEIRDWVWTEE